MALGTNYKRNVDREQAAINKHLALVRDRAQTLIVNYGIGYGLAIELGSKVTLGRITMEDAAEIAQAAK